MERRTKPIIPLLCLAFLFAAVCPRVRAEAGATKALDQETAEAVAGRKQEKTKKKAKPVQAESEYKFIAADATPAYRFDKAGNPILKSEKNSKGDKGGGKKSRASKNSAAAQSAIPRMKAAAKPRSARYVCPMGDYEGDKPGQCPKCGMTLVEKT